MNLGGTFLKTNENHLIFNRKYIDSFMVDLPASYVSLPEVNIFGILPTLDLLKVVGKKILCQMVV